MVRVVSLVGAVVFVLGGLSVKTTGFFSVSGGMPLIALLTFLGWILIASLLLVRRSGVETTVPRPATAGM